MKRMIVFACFCCSFFLSLMVRGEYLTPEEAGFRNCALIYYNENYNAEAIKPLLVKYVDGKPTDQAGYDAILFLLFSVNGKETLTEKTTLADWRDQIDIYFHRGINVPALDIASKDLRSGGFLKNRVKVVFSIPWPHPEMKDFGDVDGDGKSENLGTTEGLDKVLNWYITEVAKEMKKYPELDFWGFYMMNEGLNERYHDLARQFCKTIHDHGFRALWIPYFNAPGADVAYDLGFDASIMQSNWTFNAYADGSGARRNRLINTAEWAQKNRHGIELEINPPEDPFWQDIFARSLETGTQTGFQQGASATYFGSDFYWPQSDNPKTKALYSLWMDYLAGKPIQLTSLGKWTQKVNSNGSAEILYQFEKETEVHLVDLYYRDFPNNSFAAMVTVEGRPKENGPWIPLGWKNTRVVKTSIQSIGNLTVQFKPVFLKEMRIVLKSEPELQLGKLVGVEPEKVVERLTISKSYRKPYTTSKKNPPPTYPDESGRDLFDGQIGGNWKNYIGWSFTSRSEVTFDFGNEIEFDEIRLHLLEHKPAGIAWPEMIEAAFSLTPGIQMNAGFGSPPDDLFFESDFQGEPSSGLSTLKTSQPHKARSMTIRFTKYGWIFLSEVEFFYCGKKLPTDQFTYTLSQLNRLSNDVQFKYADDGFMLTDGYASSVLNRGNVGLQGGKPLIATVDLQNTTEIKKITCWLLDGQYAGVRMPKKGVVRFSQDGKKWTDPVPLNMPESQKRRYLETIPVSVQVDAHARFVQVEFSNSGYWIFLSEVLVE